MQRNDVHRSKIAREFDRQRARVQRCPGHNHVPSRDARQIRFQLCLEPCRVNIERDGRGRFHDHYCISIPVARRGGVIHSPGNVERCRSRDDTQNPQVLRIDPDVKRRAGQERNVVNINRAISGQHTAIGRSLDGRGRLECQCEGSAVGIADQRQILFLIRTQQGRRNSAWVQVRKRETAAVRISTQFNLLDFRGTPIGRRIEIDRTSRFDMVNFRFIRVSPGSRPVDRASDGQLIADNRIDADHLGTDYDVVWCRQWLAEPIPHHGGIVHQQELVHRPHPTIKNPGDRSWMLERQREGPAVGFTSHRQQLQVVPAVIGRRVVCYVNCGFNIEHVRQRVMNGQIGAVDTSLDKQRVSGNTHHQHFFVIDPDIELVRGGQGIPRWQRFLPMIGQGRKIDESYLN